LIAVPTAANPEILGKAEKLIHPLLLNNQEYLSQSAFPASIIKAKGIYDISPRKGQFNIYRQRQTSVDFAGKKTN
jgi:hypothetical protein